MQNTDIGYFEKRLEVFNKIFFWTIIFYPLMLVVKDIYENKEINNNNYWIRKNIFYGLFLSILYPCLLIVSQVKMDYLPINIFLIFGILYLSKIIQDKFWHNLFLKERNETLTELEIKNIDEVQLIDLDKNNQKIKNIFRTIFVSILILTNIYIYKYQSHYIATFISLSMIVIYDICEQKYFKRDKINLFWKKRITFYICVIIPILLSTAFIVYDTLIFKY